MAKDPRDFDELARNAQALGFRTSSDDYRLIGNRLKALEALLAQLRAIDVSDFEPASTFSAGPGHARIPGQ